MEESKGNIDLNQIIGGLLDWCRENKCRASIDVFRRGENTILMVTLRGNKDHIRKDFYIPKGKPSCEDWEILQLNEKLDNFLKDALKKINYCIY